MKNNSIIRLYEIIACLLILACLAQMLGGAPSYDAQLIELQKAMGQSWQRENQQVTKGYRASKKKCSYDW